MKVILAMISENKPVNMRVIPIIVLLLPMVLSVQAQEIGRVGDVESEGTAYHVFARPGEATVQVLVVGTSRGDGIYEVGAGTTLDELMVLVGGPALGPRQRGERREITLRLFRQEGGRRTLVYEASMQQLLTEPDTYPALQDGDVFTMEVVEWSRFKLENALRIVTSAATLYLAIDRISRAFK